MQALKQLCIPLSHLLPGRRNPRKVKASKEAHQRLVALIRSQGLLQPLVVRPVEGKAKQYEVVAGERRLRALKEIHRDDGDPRIPCVLGDVDDQAADAMALAENIGREAMHPLDEAEAFAKLAASDGMNAEELAAHFGEKPTYIRQRIVLASLAGPLKQAYRAGEINTAIAEAFAAVPADRQLEVFRELDGHPRHAEQVRNVIGNSWIDAQHALFDPSSLPPSSVSQDLFSERVLVERRAFLEAQTKALEIQRQALVDEGWQEVVVARREDVQDRLYSMQMIEKEFDESTTRKLEKLVTRRQKLEAMGDNIDEGDQAKVDCLQQRYEELESREQEIIDQAAEHYSEETKSMATAFLILDPDGRVHREYRLPRRKPSRSTTGNGDVAGSDSDEPRPPTPDDLSDKQLAATFTHQALAVREALLKDAKTRKRVLAMLLHDKIRSEALSVRHEANGTTLHASGEQFQSAAFSRLMEKRTKLDPFFGVHYVDDLQAYLQLRELSAAKLEALIDLLIVQSLTAHPLRPTELIHQLALELKIEMREHWRPDSQWLASFNKVQLAKLIIDLRGEVHAPAPDRKKSELVEALAKIFTDAAEGKLDDLRLTQRVNAWLPANLRNKTTAEVSPTA